MATTGKDLARQLAPIYPNLTIGDCETLITDLFAAIREKMGEGDLVRIKDFGVFSAKFQAERKNVRNPRTGELMDVSARFRGKFKPSEALDSRIDELAAEARQQRGVG